MTFESRRALAFVVFAFLGAACGDSPAPANLLWVGSVGRALPASTEANVFWIDVGVNGRPGPQAIVDTGAPYCLFDVDAFDGQVPKGSGRVATMQLGDTVLWKVPTVGVHGEDRAAPNGKRQGGILGFTAFGQFPISFNYRDSTVAVGGAPPPAGVGPRIAIPFSIEGGGRGRLPDDAGIVPLDPSRIIVTATVEGVPGTYLLDTGASWVALRTAFLQSLAADGRKQVADIANLAEGETAMTTVTRLRTISVEGIEVTNAIAAAGLRVDELLTSLAIEVGHPIDGLLGAPFLREFFVTVDYPKRALELYRFDTQSHVKDAYRRVGIDLTGRATDRGMTYVVRSVYPGSDAQAKGLKSNERVLSIDGVSLADADALTADMMLLGQVGTTRALELPDRTVDVAVEDLLPLP
ncbi:MAG TPA: aspartyl protease family protein [Polyangiaceae bacterium]|nr:aspartyl protease family protein [Polyangiaceae bacterium]